MANQLTRIVPAAVVLTTSPKRIRSADANRLGFMVQNRNAAAEVYIRPGGDGHALSYAGLPAGGNYDDDILPGQEEVWAYSDTDGAVLTLWEKYRY